MRIALCLPMRLLWYKKDYLEAFYIASAQGAMDRGEDLSKLDWLDSICR